jgi:hypothetical protein
MGGRIGSEGSRIGAERAFHRTLSLSGAQIVLGLTLVGPIALAPVGLAIVTLLIATPPRARADERFAPDRSLARLGAEAEDLWWAWRVVEPEEAYLRRRAA